MKKNGSMFVCTIMMLTVLVLLAGCGKTGETPVNVSLSSVGSSPDSHISLPESTEASRDTIESFASQQKTQSNEKEASSSAKESKPTVSSKETKKNTDSKKTNTSKTVSTPSSTTDSSAVKERELMDYLAEGTWVHEKEDESDWYRALTFSKNQILYRCGPTQPEATDNFLTWKQVSDVQLLGYEKGFEQMSPVMRITYQKKQNVLLVEMDKGDGFEAQAQLTYYHKP